MISDLIRTITSMSYTADMWLLLALATAGLSGSYLLRITQTERTQRNRLDEYRGVATPAQTDRSLWYGQLGRLVAASPVVGTRDQQRLLKLLAGAGIKARGSLASFFTTKLCAAVVLAGLSWIAIEWQQLFADMRMARVIALGVALLIGWRLPDLGLNRLVKWRRSRLEKGIPDALDLLVVCAEAGLSLNQSIDEISRQLRPSNKDVADEFAETAAEMRVLSDFTQALDNLVERTGLPDLRGLIATLKQSIKFGTSLAESLRVIAAEMRVTRQARMEERAARLPVLLAVPMMLFILPCLLMIIGTPVVLRIMGVFSAVHHVM